MFVKTKDFKNLNLLILGIIALFFSLPNYTNHQEIRNIKKKMSIQASQLEPPREAFEQVFLSKKIKTEFDQLNEVKISEALESGQAQRKIASVILSKDDNATQSNQSVYALPQGKGEEYKWINRLPDRLKDRVIAADRSTNLLDQDWKVQTSQEIFSQKVQAAINNTTTATSTQNTTPSNDFGFDSINPTKKKVWGRVTLTPGLALGDRTLNLHHFVEGTPVEAGHIDVIKGTFFIHVEKLSGVLNFEMTDSHGNRVASSDYRLSKNTKIDDLRIELNRADQVAVQFNDFNKNPYSLISDQNNSSRGIKTDVFNSSLTDEKQSDELGSYNFKDVSKHSWLIMRGRAKGFNESIFLSSANEEKRYPLFSKSLINAFNEITENDPGDLTYVKNNSLVWGQVLHDGKPIQGAAVILESETNISPYFLDGFIPTKEKSETTANGYFLFKNVSSGLHSVKVMKDGHYFSHANVYVDHDSISVVEVSSLTKKQTTTMRVFDGFSGKSESANVEIQSLPNDIFVDGQLDIDLQPIRRLSLGRVLPIDQSFLSTNMVYSDDEQYIHIPLLRRDWLRHISAESHIDYNPNLGIVVGFVPEDDFEVYLTHESDYISSNKIYFDMRGNITPTGIQGGGFILFNVPTGVQSVVVDAKNLNLLNSQVIPVDPNSLTTLKYKFY